MLGFLTIESSHPESIDLELTQQKKRDRALSNFIKGITPAEDFPGGVIPRRPKRGGGESRYIPAWWYIEQANALLSNLWSFEVISETEVGVGKDLKSVRVQGKVTVHVPGTIVEDFNSEGILVKRTTTKSLDIVKTQFGGVEVKRYPEDKTDRNGKRDQRAGQLISLADDYKSAATESMKKCFSLIGFSPDIYKPEDTEVLKLKEKENRLRPIYKAGEKLGYSGKEIEDFCLETEGIPLSNMGAGYVIKFIVKVRALPKKSP